MTRPRLAALGLAFLASAFFVPAAARAQGIQVPLFSDRPISVRAIPIQFGGQLTVDFHGDSASGCAGHGLCGYRGTVSWRPPPTGQLEIVAYRHRGQLRHQLVMSPQNPSNFGGPDGGVTTAAVQYQAPSAPAATRQCLDAATSGGQISLPLEHGRVAFTLADSSPSVLETRCAGPLVSDILPEMPAPALTLGRVMRGQTTLALTAARSFASGGFAGDVQSSVTIRLGQPGPAAPISSPGFPGHNVRYRRVQVTYRASLTGTLVERVRGSADPDVCALLGSCGVQGTLTLLPHVTGATGELSAIAPASTPYQDLLAALGLSRRGRANGINVLGNVNWQSGGRVQSDLGVGSTTCVDSAPLGSGAILLTTTGARLNAQYGPGYFARTRCPGPEFSNDPIFGGGETLLPESRRRTITVSLTSGSGTRDYGYSGQAIPHLTLRLTRVRVATHFQVGPASPF